MTDQDCVQFLKWSLPRLHLRWNGFRRVRRQVCKRISARLQELGLTDIHEYRSFIEANNAEWDMLDSLCRVSISRFYRDQEVFRSLEQEVLVRLSDAAMSAGRFELRCWSIGCASGEEPYTLAILWDHGTGRLLHLQITIVASDAAPAMIERAQKGCYSSASLRNLPPDWIREAFVREGDIFRIRSEERRKVLFLEQDVRTMEPEGLFDLILCRNVVFTYFDAELQRAILTRFRNKLYDPGALVIGVHEALPEGTVGFERWPGCQAIYRRTSATSGRT